jgi:hypothetical protein
MRPILNVAVLSLLSVVGCASGTAPGERLASDDYRCSVKTANGLIGEGPLSGTNLGALTEPGQNQQRALEKCLATLYDGNFAG